MLILRATGFGVPAWLLDLALPTFSVKSCRREQTCKARGDELSLVTEAGMESSDGGVRTSTAPSAGQAKLHVRELAMGGP